jgi:hypothetical protein
VLVPDGLAHLGAAPEPAAAEVHRGDRMALEVERADLEGRGVAVGVVVVHLLVGHHRKGPLVTARPRVGS